MNDIVIYQTDDERTQIQVKFTEDTVWLSLNQISELFNRDKSVISRHLKNIFRDKELDKNSVVAKNATTAADRKTYKVDFYNLDAIISIGYRVNSKQGTQFRIWATERLKDYLIQGYAINEKRLQQKQMEVKYLKSGIQVIQRTIEKRTNDLDEAKELIHLLTNFSQGLDLLDDYDNEQLDASGISSEKAVKLDYDDYFTLINKMRKDFPTGLFGKEKDDSFKSSIRQIYQSFNDQQLYPTIEEKAATLLYLIVKNHSFVDGNKRIAAACFLYFLHRNNKLYTSDDTPVLSNDALASITLLIAESKPEEMKIVKQVIISILNRKNQ